MIQLVALQVALYAIFPFYFARLDRPLRPAAFYIYISIVLIVGGFLGSVYSIPVTDSINISGGNLAYGALMMTSVLFVIVERDLFILRGIVRLVITVNVFKVLIFSTVALILSTEGVYNPNSTSASVFNVSVPFTILGGVLIVTELLLLLFIFEKLKNAIDNTLILSVAYIVLFVLVLCLDGVLFPSIAFGFSPKLISIVIGGVKGKLLMAAAYSIPMAFFLYIYKDRLTKYAASPPFSWQLLITSSEALMRDMRKKEERLQQAAAVFDNTREGIILTNADLSVISVNNAFTTLTGFEKVEIVQQATHLGSLIEFLNESEKHVLRRIARDGFWQGEVSYRHLSGDKHAGLLSINSVKDSYGAIMTYVGVLTDITEMKSAQEQLTYLANHDSLTHLPNRRVLLDRLHLGLVRAKRTKGKLALLIIDLDHFKDVNDSYGHFSGDELLKEISVALKTRIREVDVLCRIGGDEFAILLEDPKRFEDAAQMATEIIDIISGSWRLINGIQTHVGATIGISFFPEHGDTSELLLQHADSALYAAKKTQRGTFQYFTQSMTVAARNRIELEVRLRNCIVNDDLEVFFQPQVDIPSGNIFGAEALVRWHDPQEGYILPGDFIPLAEDTGLIDLIGASVLRKTCMQGKAWLDAGGKPLLLSVNLSPHQLRYGDIVKTVTIILDETGYPAEQLELELTESALMDREAQVIPILESLRTMGIRLAIDDFGTGYSSLAYLKHFPIDTLKIDKSFIDDIPDSTDNMELTSTIISMGHYLGFHVIAEGVETVGQLAFLASRGCNSFQGYLKSRPVSAEDFQELMKAEDGLR